MKKTLFSPSQWFVLLFGILCLSGTVVIVFIQPGVAADETRAALAVAFQVLALAAFAAVCTRQAVVWLRDVGLSRAAMIGAAVFVAILGALGACFILHYFAQEQDIKVYDSSVYWIRTIEGREQMAAGIPDYLMALRNSFSDVYNNLAAFALIPISYLTGLQFGGFALCVFFAYYLPACVFLGIFSLRVYAMLSGKRVGLPSFCLTCTLCAASAGMMWPLMQGYLDVSGVFIMALLLNVTLRMDVSRFNGLRNIALAVLSVLLLLLRRWYAYYIVAFYISVALGGVLRIMMEKPVRPKKLLLVPANLGMIAVLGLLLIAAANPRLFDLFLADYAGAYMSYDTRTLWQDLWVFVQNTRFLWMGLAVLGAVLCLWKKPSRIICVQLLTAAALVVILFQRVQDMSSHHHYLILPTVLVLACVACLFLLHLMKPVAIPATVLILAVCAVHFGVAFIPAVGQMAQHTPFAAVGTLVSYPKQNPNAALMRTLVQDLQQRFTYTSYHVYVAGSGDLLSPELLRRANLPEDTNAMGEHLVESSIEDQRDGFPSQLFMADFVLLSDPVSVSHGHPEVVYQVYDMLMHDESMRDYYEVDTRYPIAGGELILLRKTQPLIKDCVDNLKARMQGFYPDNPFVYEPNYFVALSNPQTGYWYNMWDQINYFYKWYGGAMQQAWYHVSDFTQMSFDLKTNVEGLEMVIENQNGVLYSAPVTVNAFEKHIIALNGSDYLQLTIRETDPDAQLDAEIVFAEMELIPE